MQTKEFLTQSHDDRNTQLHCLEWLPDDQRPRAIVQIIHGMAEHIERYADFAAFLTDQGFAVVGDDHLGHGKSVYNSSELGYFCDDDPATVLVEDEHSVRQRMQDAYPDLPYFILGHSMGSFILRNYLCVHGEGLAGAIIMGTGECDPGTTRASLIATRIQNIFPGGHHIAKSLNALVFGPYNKRIDNPRTVMDWLSTNEDNVDRYIADPLCGFTFSVNGFLTLATLMNRLADPAFLSHNRKDLPLLLVSGAEDPVGNYGEGVKKVDDQFRNQLGVEDVTLHLFEGDRHEILNENDRADVYAYLLDWLNSK